MKNKTKRDLKPQMPAQGILLHSDHGDSKYYAIQCVCMDPDHVMTMEVEADECDVTVHIWTKVKTDWWSESWRKRYDIKNETAQKAHWAVTDFLNGLWTRAKFTYRIWVKGYIELESWTMLNRQQALNLSEVLKTAVDDVANFREQQKADGTVDFKR